MIKPETILTRYGEVQATELKPSSGLMITRICDECGEEHRMKRSKYRPVCRKCNSPKINRARKDTAKTTCPKCGGPKSYAATTCQKCCGKSGEDNPMFGKKLSTDHPLRKRNAAVSANPELHHNWKGGRGGRSGKQVKWAGEVKEAAGHICDCCGYSRGFALEAHHYELSEALHWKEAYGVENGVPLCSNCHKEFHKTYGYGGNTKDQYLDFKEAYNA